MFCRERRQLLSQIEEAVEAYRAVVDSVIWLDGVAPEDTMTRANEAYDQCQHCRAALRRHERSHGCSVATVRFAQTA